MTLTKQQHQEIYLELDKEVEKLRKQYLKASKAETATAYALVGTVESELRCQKAALLHGAYKAALEHAVTYFNTYVK